MKAQRTVTNADPSAEHSVRPGPRAASGEASRPSPALALQDHLANALSQVARDDRWSPRRRMAFLLVAASACWAATILLVGGVIAIFG